MIGQSAQEYLRAIAAEFDRLGLRFEDGPYHDGLASAGTGEDVERHLAAWLHHLRSLEPGASFHEADPELPSHWIPGQPDTWTVSTRFAPLAPFDYQTTPAGPALGISWPPGATQRELDAFVSAVRERGVAVYGAGAEDALNRPGGRYHAIDCRHIDRIEDGKVVLDCSKSDAQKSWIDENRSRALFEREDQGQDGPHILGRSFEGTYR